MKQAQDPDGLGRRRPRMATWKQPDNPAIRPVTKPDLPAEPTPVRNQERDKSGRVRCPYCGEQVYRLVSHVRWKCQAVK